jgi:hypothetical protein
MEETPRQLAAFYYYCTMPHRNLRQLAKEFGISSSTVGVWSGELKWQERVKDFDQDAATSLREVVIGDWVETKAYLLRVLMKQVIDGVKDGIKPRNTTEMVAAIREIRSMMGDEMPDEMSKRVEIVYTRIKDGETSTGNPDL